MAQRTQARITVTVSAVRPSQVAELAEAIAHTAKLIGGQTEVTDFGVRVDNQLAKRGWVDA